MAVSTSAEAAAPSSAPAAALSPGGFATSAEATAGSGLDSESPLACADGRPFGMVASATIAICCTCRPLNGALTRLNCCPCQLLPAHGVPRLSASATIRERQTFVDPEGVSETRVYGAVVVYQCRSARVGLTSGPVRRNMHRAQRSARVLHAQTVEGLADRLPDGIASSVSIDIQNQALRPQSCITRHKPICYVSGSLHLCGPRLATQLG